MTPLVLKGFLKLGSTALGVVDVSDSILALRLSADSAEVEVPATLGTPIGARKGGTKWHIEIGYLSTDEADGVTQLFYDATIDPDGILFFEGAVTDDPISADNGLWTGSFICTGFELGGDAEALSTGSRTYTMTGAPSRAVST